MLAGVQILDGLLRPRLAMRRLAAAEPSVPDIALLIVGGYVFDALAFRLAGGEPTPPVLHLGLLGGYAVFRLLLGMLIHALGRLFDGVASVRDALAASAWQGLVAAVWLQLPVQLARVRGAEAGGADQLPLWFWSGLVLWLGLELWILASVAAEVHGFVSRRGAMLVALVLGTIFSALWVLVAAA